MTAELAFAFARLISPHTNKSLVPVAKRKTTLINDTAPKSVTVGREYIEVIVSDSRLLSKGSQWGHVAIYVNGKVYSRAHEKYFTTDYKDYINRQVKLRDSLGLVLWISSSEREIIQKELDRRVKLDEEYSVFSNSCSSNVADVLELVGILAHDPRGAPFPSTPLEVLSIVGHSNRVVERRPHQKLEQ